MNTKAIKNSDELVDIFSANLGWHKVRVKFFVNFICALCKLQTVCFTKLAQGFEGNAKVDSNLRRIQRFFAEFIIDNDMIAKLIYNLLPTKPPYRLCLDRTNWKFGTANINFLVISIAHQGIAIPLLWHMMPKRGNSNCQERKELFDRYLDLFGSESIESLMADREFIGDEWFKDLIRKSIPFYIRIREKMWIDVPGKGRTRAFWLFNSLPMNTASHYHKIVCIDGNWVYLNGLKTLNKEHKIEYVIIASFSPNQEALVMYKDRWQIESMFKSFKSSGFNMEVTHLKDMYRISKLIALICVAFVWAYLVGIYRNNNIQAIKIKKHGRRAYSVVKYGLIFIAHALLNPFNKQDFETCKKVLSCT